MIILIGAHKSCKFIKACIKSIVCKIEPFKNQIEPICGTIDFIIWRKRKEILFCKLNKIHGNLIFFISAHKSCQLIKAHIRSIVFKIKPIDEEKDG